MDGEGQLLMHEEEAPPPPPLPPPAPNSMGKSNIKIMVSALLVVVIFCLLFLPILLELTGRDDGKGNDKRPEIEQCDLFTGEWIPNPSGAAYSNDTCNFIEDPQNCIKNGRPDSQYLYWKWKPYGCDLPQFDAKKFMNAMRDKTWGFIGDSIFRNHIQSLLCLLSKVEEPVLIYHDEEYKSKTWHFPSYNLTLACIWAPFLVKAETCENSDGKSKAPARVHLDVLETKWTSEYHKYDYIVISGGQWFLKTMIFLDHNGVVGCHNCGKNVSELGVEYPYRRALESVMHFIVTADHKPLVIFRTWSMSHFEFGQWFSGGVCNRTSPYREGEFEGQPTDIAMRDVEVEVFEKAAAIASRNGIPLKLMDIFHLSLLRPDGHPGPYRSDHPFARDKEAKVQNDCLHWCLPGPIDAWNDIIMAMLLNEGNLRYFQHASGEMFVISRALAQFISINRYILRRRCQCWLMANWS